MPTKSARMQPKSDVLRISRSLSRAAEKAGAVFQRKAGQQIEYWASLGRALEAMPGISHEKIGAALTAALDFDALDVEERALVLARLGHAEATRRAPPMAPSAGGALYGRDAKGRLVRVLPDGSRERVKSPLPPRARVARKRRAG
jgi:hypothetical protein